MRKSLQKWIWKGLEFLLGGVWGGFWEVLGALGRLLVALGEGLGVSWRLLAALGGSWRLLGVFLEGLGVSWRLLAALFGGFWCLLASLGGSWRLLILLGGFGLL